MNCQEAHTRLFCTPQHLWETHRLEHLKWCKRWTQHPREGSWTKHGSRSGSRFWHQSGKDYMGVFICELGVEVNYISTIFKKTDSQSVCGVLRVTTVQLSRSLLSVTALTTWCIRTVMGAWMPTAPGDASMEKPTLCDLLTDLIACRDSRIISSSLWPVSSQIYTPSFEPLKHSVFFTAS